MESGVGKVVKQGCMTEAESLLKSLAVLQDRVAILKEALKPACRALPTAAEKCGEVQVEPASILWEKIRQSTNTVQDLTEQINILWESITL